MSTLSRVSPAAVLAVNVRFTPEALIVCLSRGPINQAGYRQKGIKLARDVADEQPSNNSRRLA